MHAGVHVLAHTHTHTHTPQRESGKGRRTGQNRIGVESMSHMTSHCNGKKERENLCERKDGLKWHVLWGVCRWWGVHVSGCTCSLVHIRSSPVLPRYCAQVTLAFVSMATVWWRSWTCISYTPKWQWWGEKCSAVFRVSESVPVTASKQERERECLCVYVCVLLSCVQYRFHIELFPFAGCKHGVNPFVPLLQGCLDASECLM